jgi:hypothetical protein
MLSSPNGGSPTLPRVVERAGRTHAFSGGARATLFEAAATAVAMFRQQGWAADALTPNAILRVEVQLPPIIHEVPLKSIERWLRSPNASPREMIKKRSVACEDST